MCQNVVVLTWCVIYVQFALLESEDVGDDLDALKREMGISKPVRIHGNHTESLLNTLCFIQCNFAILPFWVPQEKHFIEALKTSINFLCKASGHCLCG